MNAVTSATPPPFDARQRAAQLIDETPGGVFHLDGVRWGFDETGQYPDWKAHFSDAVVDTSRVKDVYVAIEPFKPEWLAAHSFLKFEFEPGAEVHNANGASDRALVVSMEAHLRQGQTFSLLGGLMRKFGAVYQVGTWSDVVQKTCRGMGHKIILNRLDLSQEQKQRLLRNTLHRAVADHSHEYYNTVTNSCLTNAMREIDMGLPWYKRISTWVVPGLLPNIAASLPRTADVILTAHRALTADAPVLIQPDKTLYPQDQATIGPVTRAAAFLSGNRAFVPLIRLASVAGAVAVGATLGVHPLGLAAMGLVGQFVGRVTAESIQRRSHTQLEPSEPYEAGAHQPQVLAAAQPPLHAEALPHAEPPLDAEAEQAVLSGSPHSTD